jgi:hypothetical protein
MNKPVVFLYSDNSDEFMKRVSANHANNSSVRLIKFEQLARCLSPAPWPAVVDDDYLPDLQEAFIGAHVINRVFNMDPDIVQSGLLRHGPHELWLHVAMQPLLNRAAKCAHDIGTRGISRSLLPLNTQWMHMSDRGRNEIRVPRFALGFGGEEPDTSNLKTPMQKSIWSYFDWKVEHHLPKAERSWHKFYVEQPRGVPVICHFLGTDTWLSFPRSEHCDIDKDLLSKLVARAQECFRSAMGEILVYVEDDGGTRFYAFSPHLTAAVSSDDFDRRLSMWIARIYSQIQETAGREESQFV